MIKVIISVKDTIGEVFNDIRVEINAATAIRAFEMGVRESEFKDDFVLYQVGTFDTITGEVTKNDPIRLYSGHDVKVNNVTPLEAEK